VARTVAVNELSLVRVRMQYRFGSVDVRAVEQRQLPSLRRSAAPRRAQTECLAAAGQDEPGFWRLAQRRPRTTGGGPLMAQMAAIGARATH